MSEKQTITLEVDEEFFENLKKQKRAILVLSGSDLIPQSTKDELEGTLNFFDYLQDAAIDELGMDKNTILDLSPDEENKPEEYKLHNEKFEEEVKLLNSQIIDTYKINYY